MSKLGSPQTTKFSIGTAELRIGPLALAMKLTQGESVGLIDNANVEVTQESVDLQGGFPKVLVDTAVISQEASITATLREYSRRNLNVLMGEGVVLAANEPADVETTIDTAGTVGATSLDVASEVGFADTDIVVVYRPLDPSIVGIYRVSGTPAAGAIPLSADTPLIHDVAVGDVVYLASQVAIGNILETNYFCVQMLQLERATARPVGFDFWKGSIGAGMTFATNAEDFGSTELQIKLLQPAVTEYNDSGDDLWHLRDILPTHPTGMYYAGGD